MSLVEAVFWAGACLGIWCLTVSAVTSQELIVATPSAVVCGVLAVAARRAYRARWTYPRRLGAWLVHLPLVLIVDTVRVLALPWQRLAGHRTDEGKFVRVAVAPGTDTRSIMRRAAAIAVVSSTPGTFVVHDDPDTGEIVVHGVLDGGPSMHEVVTK